MKIKNFIIVFGLLLLFINASFAQNKSEARVDGDVCYVYVVDFAKAKNLNELSSKSRDIDNDPKLKKVASEAEIQFPKFVTKIGEEELTTKHFRFPNSKLFITASIFYTDESMASYYSNGTSTVESILLGISISNKRSNNALRTFNKNSTTEITYDNSTNMVRTEQFLRVNKRLYYIGLECDCAAKRQNTKEQKND